MLVQKLCKEEDVGFVDLWGSFVGRADMYMKDGLHLSGKGHQHLPMNSQQQEWSPNMNEEDNTKIQNAIKEVSKGECIMMGDFNHGHMQRKYLESTGGGDQ